MIRQSIDQARPEFTPEFTYIRVLDEQTAIEAALATITEGSLIVILPESVNRVMAMVQQP